MNAKQIDEIEARAKAARFAAASLGGWRSEFEKLAIPLARQDIPDLIAVYRGQEKRIVELEAVVIDLKLGFGDAYDAMDFAASEGFEWPKDPVTINIKQVVSAHCKEDLRHEHG